ncbi:Glyoxalase/bleomycin resistance protein/dioxygenase [Segniliparus rotundus DSM 44985]|uniref:Glyoxalase/bleomycin resistance protein/dioxygenase n=1 Tax=Segniliparus rotundus (strain ATCC BAA-972 / CDC 1076 / CIP 108378 / DSM 44985 / JCM 13578) TaxID=640132 RepID=D6ZAI7_SEGRD|nr:VOC family protein [Segniliparus rotundus]ADG96729.1 Glyoxalase/bleomycin resistance protein/dioxygenase [Segniliparus rotundus DSM 44985]
MNAPGREAAAPWPTLVYEDAKAAVVFFARSFGFTPATLVGSGERVLRAELVWKGGGVAVVFSASETDQEGARSLSLVAESAQEVQELYARAVAAGARSVAAPHDDEDGSRCFRVADPAGVLWCFRSEGTAAAQEPQIFDDGSEEVPQPPPAHACAE